MKKTKLKLKKEVWITLIIIIFLLIGLKVGLSINKNIQYKKTDEYHLLKAGYTLEEINFLEKNLSQDVFKTLLNSEKNEFLLSLLHEKYYLSKNLNSYLEEEKLHPNYTPTKIVSLINTHRNNAYYDYDIEADPTKNELILVNKYYHLDDNFEPQDLTSISRDYYYGENHQINKIVYTAFKKMWEEAKNDDIYLIINASYRDYESQKKTYDSYKDKKGTTYADNVAARPGYSEHQTGLALDIFSKENISTNTYKDSETHIWLQNNAYKFGFIERYPEDKEDITGFAAEPWHWRYVGIEAATYIYNNDITFDEYYAYFVEK